MTSLPPEERPRRIKRLLIFLLVSFVVVLGVGMLGFRYIVGTDWLDSFYNSSLHFSGSGPDMKIVGTKQKLFVSFYGIIAGLVFVGLAVYAIDAIVDIQFFSD